MLRSKLAGAAGSLRDRLSGLGRYRPSMPDTGLTERVPSPDVDVVDRTPTPPLPDAVSRAIGDEERENRLATALTLVALFGAVLAGVAVVGRLLLDRMRRRAANSVGLDDFTRSATEALRDATPGNTELEDAAPADAGFGDDERADEEGGDETAESGTGEFQFGPDPVEDSAETPSPSTDAENGPDTDDEADEADEEDTELTVTVESDTPGADDESGPTRWSSSPVTTRRDSESDSSGPGESPRIAPLVGIGALVAMRLFVEWLRSDEEPDEGDDASA